MKDNVIVNGDARQKYSDASQLHSSSVSRRESPVIPVSALFCLLAVTAWWTVGVIHPASGAEAGFPPKVNSTATGQDLVTNSNSALVKLKEDSKDRYRKRVASAFRIFTSHCLASPASSATTNGLDQAFTEVKTALRTGQNEGVNILLERMEQITLSDKFTFDSFLAWWNEQGRARFKEQVDLRESGLQMDATTNNRASTAQAPGRSKDGLRQQQPPSPLRQADVQRLINALLAAESLDSLRRSLEHESEVVNNPAIEGIFQKMLDEDQTVHVKRKPYLSVCFRQLFTECRGGDFETASLRFAIRFRAIAAGFEDYPGNLKTSMRRAGSDFAAALNERTVDASLNTPDAWLPKEVLAPIRELFLHWKAKGVDEAVDRFFAATGHRPPQSGSLNGSGKNPVSMSDLDGKWKASPIGEASGMSIVMYYTFLSDGSYGRSSQSAFSFGNNGTAIGKGGAKEGRWSVDGRLLSLAPNDGQALAFEITDFGETGMITRKRNGDRWIWERIR